MIVDWIGTIRRHLDLIERDVGRMKTPSLDRVKLDYVLRRIEQLTKRQQKRRGRAYKQHFESFCGALSSLSRTVKYWDSDDLFPTYIYKCPECETPRALEEVHANDTDFAGLLTYGTCPDCGKEFVSQDGGKSFEEAA